MRVMSMVMACAGLALAGARADEVSVPIDQLPKAVAEAVKNRFPKATLVGAAKETEGGKTEYEVTLKDGDAKMDVMLTPEGKITLIEKMIAVQELPKPVTAAISAKYPKATTKSAEEVTKVEAGKESLDYYEVLVETAGKKTYELKVAADGTVKETEEKKGEEKEEKKDK